MEQINLLDHSAAIAARDAGMLASMKHADAVCPSTGATWSEMALACFAEFAMRNTGVPFFTEDVRVYAEKGGLPKPPDSRAWGGVTKAAVRAGLVEHAGWGAQNSVSCHGSPKSMWRTVE